MAFYNLRKKKRGGTSASDMFSGQSGRSDENALVSADDSGVYPSKPYLSENREAVSNFKIPRGIKRERGVYEPGLPGHPHSGILSPSSASDSEVSASADNSGNSGNPDNHDNPDNTDNADNSGSDFEDYYNRLIAVLQGYGINLTLPSLDEVYDQLEAFLRPSVDAAIRDRQNYGETVLAELDADAYARGMGRSSYLTSMKYREYENMAKDIAALEMKYSAALAEYLYDITKEFNDIQFQLAMMELQHSYDVSLMQSSRSVNGSGGGIGNGGNGGSGGRSHHGSASGGGRENGPEPSGTTFEQYQVYFQCLSDDDIRAFFHSSDEYWANLRNQMIADISADEYQYLRNAYDPESAAPRVPGGSSDSWYYTPY